MKTVLPVIRLSDYAYTLPPDRIAQYPLPERDGSRLLCCKDHLISSDIFRNLAAHIPSASLMVFNDTRVIHARLLFRKSSGSAVEVFCLEPLLPVREVQQAFTQKESCTWKCLIGNARAWKTGSLTQELEMDRRILRITAEKASGPAADGTFQVTFTWSPPETPFGEILELAGKIPLPPYVHRLPEESDNIRYQTIFARSDGSVAAPTAGLHFTEEVMHQLLDKGIDIDYLTLHIGSGTFRPVSAADLSHHTMHEEPFTVSRDLLRKLTHCEDQPVIAVGTTTVRTLESLYWIGCKWLTVDPPVFFRADQWEPYQFPSGRPLPSVKEALSVLIHRLEQTNTYFLTGTTRLMILPGYSFRVISGMVTNFHQPRSTLLMLVAAFLGTAWKEVYDFALQHDFRFLSYGDGCLFFRE